MYAYKSTAAFASALFTEQTAKAFANLLKSSRNAFVSVVSRFCCVRFLTLINNSSIFQRTNLKNLRPVRFCRFGGFIGFLSAKL